MMRLRVPSRLVSAVTGPSVNYGSKYHEPAAQGHAQTDGLVRSSSASSSLTVVLTLQMGTLRPGAAPQAVGQWPASEPLV